MTKRKNKFEATDYFAKLKALNEIIDQGGEAAKDAQKIKNSLSMATFKKTALRSAKGKSLIDYRIVSGSFENGKKR